MDEDKRYPQIGEEDGSCLTAQEPALATVDVMEPVIPGDVDYAHVMDGVLQVTPDIEEEIAAVDRGETVSLSEFKTIFARWLD